MENYKINHELNQYDYAEGIEFKGLTLSAIAEYIKLAPKLWQP